MHCELVVPGLFSGGGATRFAALELLLARGRRSAKEAQRLEGWVQEAFDLGEGVYPAGALTFAAQGADPGEESWARADPVHLRVLRGQDKHHVVEAAFKALGLALRDALVADGSAVFSTKGSVALQVEP